MRIIVYEHPVTPQGVGCLIKPRTYAFSAVSHEETKYMAIERKDFLTSILGKTITFIDSPIELIWAARNCRGILDRSTNQTTSPVRASIEGGLNDRFSFCFSLFPASKSPSRDIHGYDRRPVSTPQSNESCYHLKITIIRKV